MNAPASDSQNPYSPPMLPDSEYASRAFVGGDALWLTRAGRGLDMVYFGVILSLISSILFIGLSAIPSQTGGLQSLALLVVAAIVLARVLMFVGPWLCLGVPKNSQARGSLFAYLALQLVGVGVGQVIPQLLEDSGNVLGTTQSISSFVHATSLGLFVMFLMRLAAYLGRSDLAWRGRRILITGLTLAVAGVCVVLVSSSAPTLRPELLLIPVGIVALILFVMYVNLLNEVRQAVRSAHESTMKMSVELND